MRKIFADTVNQIALMDKKIFFLTGDLGYNVLEEVRETMGDYFINMGVAEQSMVSIAAGIASRGFQVFCYTIAPFATFRCLEQIRNDVCFHNLPVYIVGNGGGFNYGALGSSHHVIEDLAAVSGLPNMHCYIPSFDEDTDYCIHDIVSSKRPAYLRLGIARSNKYTNNSIGFFNKLTNCINPKITIAATGVVLENIYNSIEESGFSDNIEVFNISKIPYPEMSDEFRSSLLLTKKIIVVEEHINTGGLSQKLSNDILKKGISLSAFKSLCASYNPDARYGSQQYHMKKSGIDKDNISKVIKEMI